MIRLFDLWTNGALGHAVGLSVEALMFNLEFLLGVLLPIAILVSARKRADTTSPRGPRSSSP